VTETGASFGLFHFHIRTLSILVAVMWEGLRADRSARSRNRLSASAEALGLLIIDFKLAAWRQLVGFGWEARRDEPGREGAYAT
jgi:hypothetical protein